MNINLTKKLDDGNSQYTNISCGGLKYCIKIEKTTINFLFSTQKEYICKKWLPFETVLCVWNFNAVLQNVCFYKLSASDFLIKYKQIKKKYALSLSDYRTVGLLDRRIIDLTPFLGWSYIGMCRIVSYKWFSSDARQKRFYFGHLE